MRDHGPVKVSFYISFPGGGIGRYTNELMNALGTQLGADVELICLPEFEWRDGIGYNTWAGLRSISHEIATLRRASFLIGQFVNPIRGIRHAIKSGSDVIHFADFSHLTFPMWRWALERSSLKVAISAHDIKRQKAILHRGWEDWQLKSAYQYADALFVHSEYQAGELVQFANVNPQKVHVVPHGPYPYGEVAQGKEVLREEFDLPKNKQIALFFGQIRDEKNLNGFLRGMVRTNVDPHLLVAGRSGGRHRGAEFYQQLATALGIDDRVYFIDRFIEEEEVSKLFTLADWVALPYENSFTSQSGVLNVAAHYNKPVLASSSPVLAETVRKANIGVSCTGDAPASLAEGIEKIYHDVESGREFDFTQYKQDYSWEENARCTLNVYRSIADKVSS